MRTIFHTMHRKKDSVLRSLGKEGGFTILETLLALAILMAAIVGPVTLISQALWSASVSRNDLIANNLAQEGLEFVRIIRDNNIMCDRIDGSQDDTPDWRQHPGSGAYLNATYEMSILEVVAIPCGTRSIAGVPNPVLGCTNRLLLKNPEGVYNYQFGAPTLFSRCIEITNPPTSWDTDIPQTHQMDAKVTVKWKERTSPEKSIVLTERLYKWR